MQIKKKHKLLPKGVFVSTYKENELYENELYENELYENELTLSL